MKKYTVLLTFAEAGAYLLFYWTVYIVSEFIISYFLQRLLLTCVKHLENAPFNRFIALRVPIGRQQVKISGEFDSISAIRYCNYGCVWNKIFKKELAGRFKEGVTIGEDYAFTIDYLKKCRTFLAITKNGRLQ